MSTTPNTQPKHVPGGNASKRPNGLSDEQAKELLAAAGRRKDDPAYLQRLMEGVAEYRRMIQEEWERELAEEQAK